MLYIKAKHKITGTITEFTSTEWYTANKSGNYDYLGTTYKTTPATTSTTTKTSTKRGCGCGKK